MKELIIVGAGGFGRELLQWINDINYKNPQWIIKGFINDIPDTLNNLECSHKIIGSIIDWKPSLNEVFACAIGNPSGKQKVVKLMKAKGAQFINIIHPTAIIGEHNQIGEGLVMYPFSRITANCIIGDFVTILSSGIGHDVQIGDFSTISSNCTVTGHVKLGKCVFVGSNATIIPNLHIEDDVFIGAGSAVFSNLKTGVRVMGNPARPFTPSKKNMNGTNND
jgi:sugar O-acyltransferase (sialic acid O-acetyltransferase NeuD family)